MKRNHSTIILIGLAVLIVLAPLIWLKGAPFEGSDDLGIAMVDELAGGEYEPWFKPVLETAIGGELPAEIETLFFCIQTGIGVGVLAYCFGYLVARKKYGGDIDIEDGSGMSKDTTPGAAAPTSWRSTHLRPEGGATPGTTAPTRWRSTYLRSKGGDLGNCDD